MFIELFVLVSDFLLYLRWLLIQIEFVNSNLLIILAYLYLLYEIAEMYGLLITIISFMLLWVSSTSTVLSLTNVPMTTTHQTITHYISHLNTYTTVHHKISF